MLMIQCIRTPYQKPRLTLAYVMAQPPAIGTKIVVRANGNTCQFKTEKARKCSMPKPIAEIHMAGMIYFCRHSFHCSSVVKRQISRRQMGVNQAIVPPFAA